MEQTQNLMDGLFAEMNRVRDIIMVYDELPGNAGLFAATLAKNDIKAAEQAIKDNDVVKMLVAYNALKTYEY